MKKRGFLKYVPCLLLCIVAVASLSFAESKTRRITCNDVLVNIEKNPSHNDFLNVDDVFGTLQLNKNMLLGSEIANIDIYDLEQVMEQNPMVLNCETYFNMYGKLHINVTQRTPILRVLSQEGNFYIDELEQQMPLSPRGSSRVIVASGEIQNATDSVLRDVMLLAKAIRADNELLPMIEQIYVTPQREFILVSKLGPAKIEFGSTADYERKFRYLKTFYHAEKVRENWHLYKSVSLKYKNQIVCTKI